MIRNIKRFVRLLILYFKTRIINIKYKAPRVKDDLETLAKIIEEKKSLARFGDGEIALMNMQDIKFQKADLNLGERLREVLENEKEDLLVGLPNIFTLKSMRMLTFESKLFWQHELIDRRNIWYSVPKNRDYYDACVTRPYIRYENKNHSKKIFEGLKMIWKDKEILLVEGEYSRLGVGNDLFSQAKSLKRILCPAQDAYEKYDDILLQILKADKTNLILISLGPTATILSYDLCGQGYQAIDLGHIDLEYEWFLKKTLERVPIQNKLINELEEQGAISVRVNDEYEKQIVARIVK